MEGSLKDFLDGEALRINTPDFIASDPIQFPRRFSRLEDVEIVAVLSSHIAWGYRKMICNNCEKMLSWMQGQPHSWLMARAFEDLDDSVNVHRTFFAPSLKYMCRGLHYIYNEYGSLQNFAKWLKVANSSEPAWMLTANINIVMQQENHGKIDKFCFPQDMRKTALKRLNMALRWLVRNDGIVDIGAWDVLKPSQLFIPLDVHVGNTARKLGLLNIKSNDKCAVLHLTKRLREMRPDDPCYYDFALFGLGVGASSTPL